MPTANLPLRFHEPHRVTFPDGGIFVDSKGVKVAEDETVAVLKTMKKPQLFVKSKASSSGVLINRRVYPGLRMKDSVHHFLKNYGKPFLDSHPSHTKDEPKVLGRVTQAEFIQTWSDKAMADDWKHPRPNGHSGSGHIALGSVLTDADAIERAVDKRLLTTSVGFRPTAFFCSICAHDWVAENSPCGHEPGKQYEVDTEKVQGTRLAYGITGNLIYDHIAETWAPADPTAQVLSSSFQDSALTCFDTTETAATSHLSAFVLTDSDGRTFELDLAPQTPTDSGSASSDTTVFVGAVVDLSQRLAEESSMPDNDTVLTEEEAANLPPEEPKGDPPAEEPKPDDKPDAKPDEGGDDKPAEGAAEGGDDGDGGDSAEGGPMVDVNGNWTMPDPVDGHVHELVLLDAEGNGEVNEVAGAKIPKHSHAIMAGKLVPASHSEGKDKYVSRHPNTWFFDKDGKTWSFQDGKKIYADLKPEPAPEGDSCDHEFCATVGLPLPEFTPEETHVDAVETFEAPELADILEERDLFDDGKLKDASLTTKERKKVPSNLFCGQDRSFPVNDAPRVRNALSRLDQGFPKGASAADQARTRACVLRRAKQLGMKISEGAGQVDGATPTVLQTLSAELDKRSARVNQLEGTLTERDSELTALREENMALTKSIIDNQIDRVLDLKLVLGKPDMAALKTEDDIKTARQDLAKRSVDSLADAARDLQLELAQGGSVGVRPDPTLSLPVSDVAPSGGAPTVGNGSDKTLADQTLNSLSAE